MRSLLTLAVIVLWAGVVLAEDYKGKVKDVDAAKNTITVTIGDKDQTFPVGKDAKVYSLGKAKKGQPAPEVAVTGGLSGLTSGKEVTVTTAKVEDKETATSIKVEEMAKKKKDKNQ